MFRSEAKSYLGFPFALNPLSIGKSKSESLIGIKSKSDTRHKGGEIAMNCDLEFSDEVMKRFGTLYAKPSVKRMTKRIRSPFSPVG